MTFYKRIGKAGFDLDTIYVACLVLIILFMPFFIQTTNILIAVAAGFWLFFDRRKKFSWSLVLFTTIIIFVIYAIGLIHSADLKSGLSVLEKRLPLLAFPLIFSTAEITENRFVLLLRTLIIAVSVAAGYSLGWELVNHYQAYGGIFPLNYDFFKLSELTQGIELDPPYFGLYIGFALLALSYLIKNKAINLAMFIALSVFLGAFLLLSGARTAIVATLICFSMFWIIYGGRTGMIAVVLASVAVVVLIVSDHTLRNRFVDATNLSGASSDAELSSLSLRVAKWKTALDIFSDSPLFGVGTGDAQTILIDAYREKGMQKAVEERYNAHNEYLDAMVALGIFGALALALPLGASIILTFDRKDWFYLIFVVLIVISMMTESLLARQKGVVFIGLFNSLLFFSHNKKRSVNPH